MIGLLVAAQLAVTLHAPDTIPPRGPTTITVEATAPGVRPPRITAPSGAAFRLVLTGAATRTTASIGSRWNTVEQQYELTPRRAGTITIPPFEARAGSASARTRPHRVVVRATPSAGVPPLVAGARLDADEGVLLRAAVAPETVYVGQQATYQVAVFLDDDVRLRLRRNPEFVPPEPRGMLAYELLPPTAAPPMRVAGGKRYEAHVFQRAIFPLGAGRYVVPQAQLVYSLPLSASFFSREESHTVRADSVAVIAIEPPAAGRPADWFGAVGELSVDTRVDSSTGRAGDPVVVTLRVAGRGNVKLLPRPQLSVPWGTAVESEERVRLDTSAVVVRGAKEFDWLVTPRESGTLELPAIRYPFFNPYTERYEIAVTAPREIVVAPGALASVDSGRGSERAPLLALRPTLREPRPAPVHEHPAFWAVALAAPLPAAAMGLRRRPRRRRRARSPDAALRTFARSRGDLDASALRRVYVAALAERLDLTPGAITTTRGALSHALRRAGVTGEAATAAESLLVALDAAAYSPGAPPPEGAARAAWERYARVDAEARTRLAIAARRLSFPVIALVAASALAGAAALHAADAAAGESSEQLFARGGMEYRSRRFPAAAALFARVAARQPRAADAWANLGTASWAASDTATAVAGWQRALRLEPLAGDVRDRLALVGTAQGGLVAGVPRLPLDAVTIATLALWCSAWAAVLLAALHPRRGQALLRCGAACGALVVVGGMTAREVAHRLAADSLAVVRGHEPLRTLPALGAERGAALATGDVARVVRREGVWARVQLDGDRDGWVEWERLLPLAASAPPARGG